jgi:NAD(P)-dependent dehydrogenase (short-subunit alcohol dehydrogenase family)
MDLSQARHAFITGGASGIGLAIADALARRGIPITIADVDQEGLDSVIAERQGKPRGQCLDVRDRRGWAAAKAEAEAALGPVDILVNNAGIGPDGRELADAAPESFDRILGINLVGVFNGVSAFASDMRARQKGHIVNTGSMSGLSSQRAPGIGGYTVSKFGVVALTEVLRDEMAPYEVGVSALCPGLVASNLRRTTRRLSEGVPASSAGRRRTSPVRKAGMDAADVGEMTVEGIAKNQAYIITHRDGWPDVEARMRALEAAFLQA